MTTAGWLWRRWRRAERDTVRLEGLVAERQAERDEWRRNAEEVLAGLAVAIDRQLDAWRLTPTEREVGVAREEPQGNRGGERAERTNGAPTCGGRV